MAKVKVEWLVSFGVIIIIIITGAVIGGDGGQV